MFIRCVFGIVANKGKALYSPVANANQMDVLRPLANAHTCISKPTTSQPQADHKPLAASIKTNVDHHQRNKPNQATLIDGARKSMCKTDVWSSGHDLFAIA